MAPRYFRLTIEAQLPREQNMAQLIHRGGLGGGARCGAQGRISTSGLFLTCPKCIELSRVPTREEQLAALYASIAAMKAKSA